MTAVITLHASGCAREVALGVAILLAVVRGAKCGLSRALCPLYISSNVCKQQSTRFWACAPGLQAADSWDHSALLRLCKTAAPGRAVVHAVIVDNVGNIRFEPSFLVPRMYDGLLPYISLSLLSISLMPRIGLSMKRDRMLRMIFSVLQDSPRCPSTQIHASSHILIPCISLQHRQRARATQRRPVPPQQIQQCRALLSMQVDWVTDSPLWYFIQKASAVIESCQIVVGRLDISSLQVYLHCSHVIAL